MPSCEADDIEFAMLKPPPDHDEESASLPPEFEKPSRHRGCSKKTSIMVGMVAVLLTYFAGCSVAYQFGYHGTGFLLEAWLLAVPFGLFLIVGGSIVAHRFLKEDLNIRSFWRWIIHVLTVLMYIGGCIVIWIIGMKGVDGITYQFAENMAEFLFIFLPFGFLGLNAIIVAFIALLNMEGNA